MSEHSHDNKPGELEESRLVVDNDFEVAPVNDRLFGSFVAAISFPAIAGRMALVLVMSGRVAWTWHGIPPRPISLVCTKWRNGWKKPAATS